MARPIQADAEATRRRILATAQALFARDGIAETTMRRIARGAGVTMATVHHYYGSKADLYTASVQAMHAELGALRIQLEAALARPDLDLGDLIEVAVRHMVAFARANRANAQLMMRVVLDHGRLPDEERERHLRPFLDRSAELIAARLGRDPLAVRVSLLSLNHLIARYAISSPEELSLILFGDEASAGAAAALVEDHLVRLARREIVGDQP